MHAVGFSITLISLVRNIFWQFRGIDTSDIGSQSIAESKEPAVKLPARSIGHG